MIKIGQQLGTFLFLSARKNEYWEISGLLWLFFSMLDFIPMESSLNKVSMCIA
jgi:hypothetical protein